MRGALFPFGRNINKAKTRSVYCWYSCKKSFSIIQDRHCRLHPSLVQPTLSPALGRAMGSPRPDGGNIGAEASYIVLCSESGSDHVVWQVEQGVQKIRCSGVVRIEGRYERGVAAPYGTVSERDLLLQEKGSGRTYRYSAYYARSLAGRWSSCPA